jgi:hypothetical protein
MKQSHSDGSLVRCKTLHVCFVNWVLTASSASWCYIYLIFNRIFPFFHLGITFHQLLWNPPFRAKSDEL